MKTTKQLLIGCILLLVSCKYVRSTKRVNELKGVIDNVLGKQLNIPKNLKLYKPFTNLQKDSLAISKSDYKIYSLIDASCSKCITSIEKWKDIHSKLNKSSNVSIILMLKSDDDFQFFKYMVGENNIKNTGYPFFLDVKDELERLNPFMRESHGFGTVLTNKNNEILLIGDPLISEKTYEIYQKQIEGSLD